MIRKFFDKLFGKNTTEQPHVELQVATLEPEQKICSCGRSRTGYCIGLHTLSAEEWEATRNVSRQTKSKPTKPKTTKPKTTESEKKTTTKSVAKSTTKKTATKKENTAWPFDAPLDVKPAAMKAKRKYTRKVAAVNEIPPPIPPILEQTTKTKKKQPKTKNV